MINGECGLFIVRRVGMNCRLLVRFCLARCPLFMPSSHDMSLLASIFYRGHIPTLYLIVQQSGWTMPVAPSVTGRMRADDTAFLAPHRTRSPLCDTGGGRVSFFAAGFAGSHWVQPVVPRRKRQVHVTIQACACSRFDALHASSAPCLRLNRSTRRCA